MTKDEQQEVHEFLRSMKDTLDGSEKTRKLKHKNTCLRNSSHEKTNCKRKYMKKSNPELKIDIYDFDLTLFRSPEATGGGREPSDSGMLSTPL